jgi:pantoate--beta-alanine ligase
MTDPLHPPSGAPLAVARTVAELRARVAAWRAAGETVALVPTMGALHDGHLSLVALARSRCRRVVASIFVNPAQFGPNEDFSRYPRREAQDAALLAEAGTDLLYAPDAAVMYPEGFATTVTVSGPTDGLCGPVRPGHFAGVATVVAKLLLQCLPDAAVFGEKDYQQLQVIRRLVRDLDIPVEILGAPTVRDAQGLALSSRNAYLAPERVEVARMLNRILLDTASLLRDRPGEAGPALAAARSRITQAGFTGIDYVELADAATLEPLERADRPARLLAAVWLDRTRLIDNVPV